MIKIRYRGEMYDNATNGYKVEWRDAFLVQIVYAHNETVAFVAYEDAHGWGNEQGLKVMPTKLDNIRIARTRIPLFSMADANGAKMPDAATKPPAIGPAFYQD